MKGDMLVNEVSSFFPYRRYRYPPGYWPSEREFSDTKELCTQLDIDDVEADEEVVIDVAQEAVSVPSPFSFAPPAALTTVVDARFPRVRDTSTGWRCFAVGVCVHDDDECRMI